MFWKLENLGPALALHWMAIVKFPTGINGKSVCFTDEKPTTCETEEGKSFLELRIYQKIASPPLFPGSDISRSFPLSGVTYQPPLKPSITNIQVKTFATTCPRSKRQSSFLVRLDVVGRSYLKCGIVTHCSGPRAAARPVVDKLPVILKRRGRSSAFTQPASAAAAGESSLSCSAHFRR
jgi:hypothetical protein